MPEPSSRATIELLRSTATTDHRLVGDISQLVNEVYAVAEVGLWLDGSSRTTPAEIAEMIAAGEIAVARRDGHVVGSVRVHDVTEGVGEFGMLVSNPAHRGEGIGRELVAFAEAVCRRRGLITMQLELLVPRGWSHPTKVFLDDWYRRMGYQPVFTDRVEKRYPHLAPLLAVQCDFVLYQRPLVGEQLGPS